jgi:RNA polymerase sigma factor (sigma-70 family)
LTSLVSGLRQKAETAVESLVTVALPRLVRLAMRYGASREDAEDIALDAIVETLARLDKLEFEGAVGTDPLYNYLARAAHNGALMLHRARSRENAALASVASEALGGIRRRGSSMEPGEDDDPADDEADLTSRSEAAVTPSPQILQLREYMSTLSEQDRLLLLLHAEEVLSSAEIGDVVGLEPANVRQRVSRLHRAFRAKIRSEEDPNVGP